MNIQNLSSDIISTLPQDIIENILTLIPIKDAVKTNSILEFNVNFGQLEMYSQLVDIIIRHLSRRTKVEKLAFQISNGYRYKLPSSFFSLQGLKSSEIDRFGDKDEFEGRNKFTLVELLQCVPLTKTLGISYIYMKYLSAGGMSQKLPASLVHLNILFLDVCFTEQDEISSALCFIRNSPNLKTIGLRSIVKLDAAQIPMNILNFQNCSSFKMDYFKKLGMINFSNLAPELEFVKLIMAKSPKLELVRIELSTNVSADEELKILRDFKRPPFTLASPSAKFSMERRKPSS
ncbi:F-box/FBD/LRR-repeat protein [Tanacetum coccineum]